MYRVDDIFVNVHVFLELLNAKHRSTRAVWSSKIPLEFIFFPLAVHPK
jgi:hypothetical protein